ncbi:penicillin-binding transpeptidase domain-containing protein [Floricoccus penangensis]|uniref:penicillin-binding protein PBP4(5) n=1 Tax=Floricoccus penangensis TaxID=1859475 RepID=UPI00203BB109|nr:penicillin-binding transpeptidase domain-containing protein [Floricoccus penangensis]URZ86795.1 penicillin-binding transpeptidase domain-containing protein [Floricoccus penangensis]
MKNKKNLAIASGIAIVVLAVGGYLFYQHQREVKAQNAREDVINKFASILNKQDFEDLSGILDKDSLKKIDFSADEVAEKYKNVYGGISASNVKINDLKFDKKNKDSFTYNLKMSTSLGQIKDLKYSGQVTVTDGKHAKINWTPSLIFPKMSGKDKVSISINQAERGTIYDRNNQPLAVNSTLYQLGVVPESLGEGEEKSKKIAEISSKYDIPVKNIESAIGQSWVQPQYFVPLKTYSVEPTDVPKGATITKVDGRYYPLKEAAAQLIGYVGQITKEDIDKNPALSSEGVIGRTGLEMTYDKELRGKDGGKISILDENGEEKEILIENKRENGQDFKLTIDSGVQETAFKTLDNSPGSSVVTEPKTGDLLALVSSPSFDPNKFATGISSEDYKKYSENEDLPFISRFATGYAPGSTFKTITGVIGLDNGTINPDEAIEIDGLKWQKDNSWGSYQVTRVQDHSPVDLKQAYMYSDNIYFAKAGLKMGEDKFRAGLNKFIFGEELDLPIAMNPAQISNGDKFDSEILFADTAYGQGQLLISPIEQATMYSIFPNNGTLVYPKLLLDAKTKTKPNVASEKSVAIINQDLQSVVKEPSAYGYPLDSLGYPLAAKTGTAEIKMKQDEKGKENSFLLVYDAQDQKYLVVTLFEGSKNGVTAISTANNLVSYLHDNIK